MGAPTYGFAKISQKLHEIEGNFSRGGGARPKFYNVDPPLNSQKTPFSREMLWFSIISYGMVGNIFMKSEIPTKKM